MHEVQFIKHKDTEIISVDFSICENRERILEVIEIAKKYVKSRPAGTALTLTNFKNVLDFDMDLVDVFEKYSEHNRAYVKKAALLGISGLSKVAYDSITKATGRALPIFDDQLKALEWLVSDL